MKLSSGTKEQVNLHKFSLRRMSMVGGRSQENTLNKEQIRKNCGNMGTHSNFVRKDGNTGQCQNGTVLSNLPRAYITR